MANRIDIQYIDFSIEGNAARKLSAAPRKKVQLPKAKKKTRYVLRLDPLSAMGIMVAIFMVVLMGMGIARLNSAYEQNRQMSMYVDALSEKNAELREEFTEVCDLEEIKHLALALGMVPKEEAPQTGISMYVPPVVTEQPTLWERIGIFLASLFA